MILNAYRQAQEELISEAYRKKVDRVKELIVQFELAKSELAKAQHKFDGIDKALQEFRRESPEV